MDRAGHFTAEKLVNALWWTNSVIAALSQAYQACMWLSVLQFSVAYWLAYSMCRVATDISVISMNESLYLANKVLCSQVQTSLYGNIHAIVSFLLMY